MTEPRQFYGWKLVAALWVLEFLNMGFPFYGGSVINSYMLKQIHMTRSMYGLGFTLLNVCIGAPSFLIVESISRWGLRGTFVIGSSLIFIGALWLSVFATESWHYLLGFGVFIGTGVGFGTIVPLSTAITRWFRRYRGRAMAIAFSASGFAGFVGAPALNAVLTRNGGDFQQAWRFVAGIAGLAALTAILFVKENPSDRGETVDGLPDEARNHSAVSALSTDYPWTPREACGTRSFWLIMMGSIACQFPFFFFNAHWILHLQAHQISSEDAAWAIGLFTLVGIGGRFVGGWLLDRLQARYVFMLGVSGYFIGSLFALFVGERGYSFALMASVCYGGAFGCSWIALNTITGNFYGIAAYPKLNGAMMTLSAFTCAPAGVIGGQIFDIYKSYEPVFVLNAALSAVSMIALFFAVMPTPPSRLGTESMARIDSDRPQ